MHERPGFARGVTKDDDRVEIYKGETKENGSVTVVNVYHVPLVDSEFIEKYTLEEKDNVKVLKYEKVPDSDGVFLTASIQQSESLLDTLETLKPTV